MPIYEYKCGTCGVVFERLELKVRDIPTSQCPMCVGVGTKLISKPAIVYEVFDESAVHKLPGWKQQMKQAELQDKRTLRSLGQPLEHDMGQQIKVYQTEFGKSERNKLEQKAQLDNMG